MHCIAYCIEVVEVAILVFVGRIEFWHFGSRRRTVVRSGTLTVNVADFLMRWTNGLYKSTVHRVVSKPGTPARYSVPFFFSINYDAEVEALPERTVGKSLFRPMKAGEYVLERLKATKTLGEDLRILGTVSKARYLGL
jgi:hypothetical protein